VVTRPDPKKGEVLVLFTTCPEAQARDLQQWGRLHGATELMIPRDIRVMAELPVLGTGKVDYVTLGEMAQTAPTLLSDDAESEDEPA
jgi:acyl-[acyl-carrier-protein]-phospholipid O-acyltransferase/long-chain-fatty-acid--[acyl-carrier-protein] ligase